MYVEDIADIRALRPWIALSVTMERRAIRLGKLFAGELFVHRERARHAAALLHAIAEDYFRQRPSFDRDLVWTVSEFEETQRCEIAGAALFIAFAEGRAKDDDLVETVTTSLLDQLALIHRHGQAMSNTNLELGLERELQRGLADSPAGSGPQAAPTISAKRSAPADTERPGDKPIGTPADAPRSRGFALLNAAALKGRLNICARGAPPFVIEVADARLSRDRSYRRTLKLERQVDGLRWHSLAFSVHGAPLTPPDAANDEGSGQRFFSGKVDARMFAKLLPHFVDRSFCIFELHEFIDPLAVPGKGSTYEMNSFEFIRKADTGLFAE